MTTGIDTVYAGCYFRSRLEARWALAFDILNIRWQYEPQGYQVGDGAYLPDFLLTDTHTWVEVKGTEADFLADTPKYTAAVHPDHGLPGIRGSLGTTRGFLTLGHLPRIGRTTPRPVHTLIQHGAWDTPNTVLCRTWAAFTGDPEQPLELAGIDGHSTADTGLPPAHGHPYTVAGGTHDSGIPSRVAIAYTAARAARFDQGRTGLNRSVEAALDDFRRETAGVVGETRLPRRAFAGVALTPP